MRRHKFIFSIYKDFKSYVNVPAEYSVDGIYEYLYHNTKISAGNVFKVRESVDRYEGEEVKEYYAISSSRARGGIRRGFWMTKLNEEGLEYFYNLAVENKL